MTLLVVDDDRNILELMSGVLSVHGYDDVVYAQSGADALDMIQSGTHRFSTFFLDIQMPGMDGVELCGRIRAQSGHRTTPIIMLTAMQDKAHIDAAFMRGATDYITKPIDATEVGARLRVAQLLFAEQQRSQMATQREQDLRFGMDRRKDDEDMRFNLSDAVPIYEVPRVIGSVQMENYLYRLSRIKRFMFSAVGFQIKQHEGIFALSSPIEFYGILTDVAEALFETLRGLDPMISYVGNGQFVAILPRTYQCDAEELELQLMMRLNEFGLIGGDTVPMDVCLKVGEAVRMSMFDTNPQTLLSRALMNCKTRANNAEAAKPSYLVA